MSDIRNAAAYHRQKISEWEERKEKAQKEVMLANTMLQEHQEAYRVLSADRLEALQRARTARSRTTATAPETRINGDNAAVQLGKMDEVVSAVEEIMSELPSSFVQSEIFDCLARRGYAVNRSTLRVTLIDMAEHGKHFRVSEPGKGRRATVFAKV